MTDSQPVAEYRLIERDRAHVWHPFTPHNTGIDPIPFCSGHGAYLSDTAGTAYLDLISSWWVNLHGHANPEIAQAISRQAHTLEHVIFAGGTHEPAVQLCEQIAQALPSTLTRFFFSDNGSTAVEVALKMAYQFWWNHGEKERTLFLNFEGGYHGDTFGAMSVGQHSGFFAPFKSHCFNVLSIPFPSTWPGDSAMQQKEDESLAVLESILCTHASTIAACILEPLVQGASGMRMARPEFFQRAVDCLQRNGVLVIFDEVMTGFGRTGSCFALDSLKRVPDFLCLSKGLTGGFLPLALTVTNNTIYQAFGGVPAASTFLHGHSYTANPLGCAAALASWALLNRSGMRAHWALLHEIHKDGLAFLRAQTSAIQAMRSLGTIAAFEVDLCKDGNAMTALKTAFCARNLFLRPLNQTVYLMPPYCITALELEQAYERIGDALASIR
jgi:adenosylmethionine-8-amino-7-oxononanoate aminotransferase